jgi:hypothetical protein
LDRLACGARSSGAAPASIRNACDRKLLTTADAAHVLGAPVARTQVLAGDPQTCVFTTASFTTLTVSLRPGLGRTTVATWKAGRMPVPATPLAGVGDDAAWAADLHEVIAERNDLLCDIQAGGVPHDATHTADAERQALGALCTKIFAGVR